MNKDLLKIMGLCIILPSTILTVGLVVSELISANIISTPVGIGIILSVIVAIFYKILKINNKKNE